MTCYDSCCRPEHDVEVVVLGRRQVRAARKAHRCASCKGDIPVGSPCQRISELVDGEFWSGYVHSPYGACGQEE